MKGLLRRARGVLRWVELKGAQQESIWTIGGLTKRSKLATEQPQTKCRNSVFGRLCAVPCTPLCWRWCAIDWVYECLRVTEWERECLTSLCDAMTSCVWASVHTAWCRQCLVPLCCSNSPTETVVMSLRVVFVFIKFHSIVFQVFWLYSLYFQELIFSCSRVPPAVFIVVDKCQTKYIWRRHTQVL